MSITVEEVASEDGLKEFVRFPFSLYKKCQYWVPPLIQDEMNTLQQSKNPAFEYCESRYWLAYENGRIAGRIAAILNHRHIEKWGQKYLRFGWIDFLDNMDVSAALFKAVENWAEELGMEAVHGPLGFTNMDHAGMLIDGFNELGTMATIYNFPYYPQHMDRLGYTKHADWVEYEIEVTPEPNETISRIAELSLRRYDLHLLNAKNKKDLLPFTHELFDIYNDEYRKLYSAVPLSKAQIENAIQQYFKLISPEFVPVVLDERGKMIAFGIVMPSLSHALQKSGGQLFPFGFIHFLNALRKNDRADLYLVAVREEYQGRGVNAIMMNQIHRLFIKMGIKKIETNPELEWNKNVQGQWKYYDKRQHKRRRAFIKLLTEEPKN
jgi:GNAT superfamily N-acetyltransferase